MAPPRPAVGRGNAERNGLLAPQRSVQEDCLPVLRQLGLERCAEKAGRPLAQLERLLPEADFPSRDGQPSLEVAVCRA